MRISDWSSDVCSSDLAETGFDPESLGDGFGLDGSLDGKVDRRVAIGGDAGENERAIDRLGDLAVEGRIVQFVDLEFHRSEEHTSELQSLMRISYAVFCLKKKKHRTTHTYTPMINTVSSDN